MISQDLLKLEVGETIYNRGNDYYKEKSENNITFKLNNSQVESTGKIKEYKLKLIYSLDDGQIKYKSCTCPYYDNSHKICKHIITFSLQINNKLNEKIPNFNYLTDEKRLNSIEINLDKLNDVCTRIMERKPDSVTELTKKIKQLLERNPNFLDIYVEGEISNYSKNHSGHIYFAIKDNFALISCVMFKFSVMNLSFTPKIGDKVILKGKINLYEPRGSYQLTVKEMKKAGEGDLFAKFLELKNKLEREGLFSNENKKKIPKFPKIIAVISSPTGAVIMDIINTIKRRFPKLKLVLFPVKVQGDESVNEIISALDKLNNSNYYEKIDTVIIARGGGSMEDLWCFNNEILARKIYELKIPIISAIGHETDFTISDFVSDLRAPTPTAAAELSVPKLDDLYTYIKTSKKRLVSTLKNNLENKNLQLSYLESDLINTFSKLILNNKNILEIFDEKLELLSIKSNLKRGYSLTTHNSIIIKDVLKLKKGDKITSILNNGELNSTIEDIKNIEEIN